MTRFCAGALLVIACLGMTRTSAQEAPGATVPSQLRLKGDPAPDLDLGGTRVVPPPVRDGDDGVITRAAFTCHTCLRTGAQRATGNAGVERLLGRPASVIRPWLGRLGEEEPHILTCGPLTLVALLQPRKVTDVTPEERMRLRLFLGSSAAGSRKRLDAHEQAHLWMERLLALEAALAELVDLDAQGEVRALPSGIRPLAHPRAELYLFASRASHDGFVQHLMGPDARPLDGILSEDGPASAILLDADAEACRRRFHHAATLALLQRHRRTAGGLPPWLAIGTAHFMERRLRGATRRREPAGTLPAGMESPGDWAQLVRDLAASGKAGALDALTATPLRGLSRASRVQAWSLVKFLIGVGRERYALFVRGLLHADPAEEPVPALAAALREAYGAEPAQVEQAWKEWVLVGSRR